MLHVVKNLKASGFCRNPSIFLLLFWGIFFISCSEDKAEYAPAPAPTPFPNPVPQPKPETRTLVNARLVAAGSLSQERTGVAIASAGGKLVIAGGHIGTNLYSSRVDIYDIASNSWSTAELSLPRAYIATAVLHKKIYFAGGTADATIEQNIALVDIYDTETNTWTTKNLGIANTKMTGAAAGNKVVFASGVTAHIYDAVSNTWTTAPLSERPGEGDCCQYIVSGIVATVIENTIYLAGGLGFESGHNAIDIFNTVTNQWSSSSLSEHKGYMAGIAVGNTNYWAGGNGFGLSSLVEIRDMVTGSTTYSSLFQPNASFFAVQRNNSIVFFTGSGADKSKFDIYDLDTKTWAVGSLSETIEGAGVISVDNKIYIAGGKVNGIMSKQFRVLEF